MGWSFACDTSHNKKACIAELRSPSRFGENTKLIRACTVGNHHWYLAETNGTKWIGLDLLQGGGKTMGWGYKSLDETCGPYVYDCPLAYIDEATAPATGYAGEWRLKVRAHHARKTSSKAFAGQVVDYGKYRYTLISPAGPRKGWNVINQAGCRYRMNFKQLARATWVNTEVA